MLLTAYYSVKLNRLIRKFTEILPACLDACYCAAGCSGGPYEKELLNALLKSYNTQNRPVLNESSPIIITFGVTLQQIVDLDEKNQVITISGLP